MTPLFPLGVTKSDRSTSRSSNTDEAVQRVEDAFEGAAEEAGELSDRARQEFDEAIGELETKIERLCD